MAKAVLPPLAYCCPACRAATLPLRVAAAPAPAAAAAPATETFQVLKTWKVCPAPARPYTLDAETTKIPQLFKHFF